MRWLVAATAGLLLLAGSALAELAQQITWDDLLPQEAPLIDPLRVLPPAQRYEMGYVAQVRHLIAQDQLDEDSPAIRDAEGLAAKLAEQGVDVDDLSARFAAYAEAKAERELMLNDALDGRTVRIPGYLLPLEFEGSDVSEFLLVPYVGACIHVPPPPPNQIVHVNLDQSFTTRELFTAVWVTGEITAENSSQSLSFVDGTSDIAVGYVISNASVEPYSN